MSAVDEIYLIHHCHTDIGYTHDQPTLWDLQRRFIEQAIDLADRDRDVDAPHAFKWTVETTAPLLRWLDQSDPDRIERFLTLEDAGRIEVTGMFTNVTPLYGPAQTAESLRPVRHLREEYGLDVRYAMNCDVNGQNWPIADTFLDAGIEGLSMAINEHFGGAPLDRPEAFRWEAPSGRELLALNGLHYSTGWRIGIGHDAEGLVDEWWPRVGEALATAGYDLPVLPVQGFHPFGDNATAYAPYTTFIEDWNAREDVLAGDHPRIRMATPSEYWAVVEAHRDDLPRYAGDWTDFWNFGSGSSARETAINRESRRRLHTADALEAGLTLAGAGLDDRHPARRSASGTRDDAWWALNLFDEHTWGADASVAEPHTDDVRSQWYHDAGYAYDARTHSQRARRDAVAELARRVRLGRSETAEDGANDDDWDRDVRDGHAKDDANGDETDADDGTDLLLYNPLPWPRKLSGAVDDHVVDVRGTDDDPTAGRHFQDRRRDHHSVETLAGGDEGTIYADQRVLSPTVVPGNGYTVVDSADLVGADAWSFDERATVETDRYEITFDRERGGIAAWYDAAVDHQWVDEDADWPLAGFVHEELVDEQPDHPWNLLFRYPEDADWDTEITGLGDAGRGFQPDWHARRTGPTEVLRHRVYETPLGYDVRQRLAVPQVESDVALRVLVPTDDETVVVEASWVMGQRVHPESTYLAFPFHLPDPVAHVDVGNQAVRPGRDQLEGSVHDYYTAQRWADLSDDERGVTIGTPLNPMVQFGDFGFAADRREFALDDALFLGWVTNNYWETNFRAVQPGLVRARYHLTPYDGAFDEAAAHRRGLEAEHFEPLIQSMGEPPVDESPLAPERFLLDLPEPPVLVEQIRPAAEDDGVLHPAGGSTSDAALVTLRNAGDENRTATVGPGAISFETAALAGRLGDERAALPVKDGVVTVELAPREAVVLRLA